LIARVSLVTSLAMIPLVGLGLFPRLDLADAFLRLELFPRSIFTSSDSRSPSREEAVSTEPVESGPESEAPAVLTAWFRSWLPRSLTLIDLGCIGLGSAWLLLGFWGAHWLISRARPPSQRTRDLYDRLCCDAVRARTRPNLRVSVRIQRPVVAGLFRPTILIPASFDSNEEDLEPLRLSLLHEIAHAERADHWFGAAASLAQTIWFFLPQVWWLRSRLRMDQEFLADRSAAGEYGTTSEYASSLLSLAETRPEPPDSSEVIEPPSSKVKASEQATRSPLFQRVLMLLHCPFVVEERAPWSWSWALKFLVIGASILAACLCIRWPTTDMLGRRTRAGAAAAPRRFQIPWMVADAQPAGPGTRPVPTLIPLVLPARFDLTVEVRATVVDLSRIRIAGHLLGVPHFTTSANDPSQPGTENGESWHRIHLRQDGPESSALTVDDRIVLTERSSEAAQGWLTIEPAADHLVEFRNLVVTW
jgi:hypothetical protein